MYRFRFGISMFYTFMEEKVYAFIIVFLYFSMIWFLKTTLNIIGVFCTMESPWWKKSKEEKYDTLNYIRKK